MISHPHVISHTSVISHPNLRKRNLLTNLTGGGRGYPFAVPPNVTDSTEGTAVNCGCSRGAVSPATSNVTRDLDSLLCLPTYCYSLPPFALLCLSSYALL